MATDMTNENYQLLMNCNTDEDRNSISDGFHTFGELYEYRRVYNALLFNMWASQGLYGIHKSKLHHDGEPCFGGRYFIVVAQLPTGQVSNHYKHEHWDSFKVAERELADVWDGHTADVALARLLEMLSQPTRPAEIGVLLHDVKAEYIKATTKFPNQPVPQLILAAGEEYGECCQAHLNTVINGAANDGNASDLYTEAKQLAVMGIRIMEGVLEAENF
jgi:hypothetical protein